MRRRQLTSSDVRLRRGKVCRAIGLSIADSVCARGGIVIAVAIGLKKGKFLGVKIPFAPFLVTGSFITLFFGETLLKWYFGFLGFI